MQKSQIAFHGERLVRVLSKGETFSSVYYTDTGQRMVIPTHSLEFPPTINEDGSKCHFERGRLVKYRGRKVKLLYWVNGIACIELIDSVCIGKTAPRIHVLNLRLRP